MAERYTASLNSERDYDGDGTQAYHDESMELRLLSRNGLQNNRHWFPLDPSQPTSRTLSKRSQFWVYGQMAAFYLAGNSTVFPLYE